jgi:4-carboxymuconolactone decarboxylase
MSGENTVRVGNLPRAEWTDAARETFAFWGEPNAWEQGSSKNMTMTLAHHPALSMAYNTFGKHLLLGSTIPVRPRELIVLRTAWLVKCEYEWHYHVGYGLSAGMTLDEIAAIRDGAESAVWDGKEADRAVLSAVDELYRDSRIGDATWAVLSRHYDKHQLMDMVFTIGNYVMLSWAVSTFGIPLEDDIDKIDWDMKTRSGRPIAGTDRPPVA